MEFDSSLWILVAERKIGEHTVILYRDRSQDWVEHLVCDCKEFRQVRAREWKRYCEHTNKWSEAAV